MNTNLSTSYTALQTERNLLNAQAERGWQAEQAAAGSRKSFSLGRLSEMAAAIVTSVHQFVDPRGYAMTQFEANQRKTTSNVPALDTPVIAPAAAETASVVAQPAGIVTTLPSLRPVAPDAVETPAAA